MLKNTFIKKDEVGIRGFNQRLSAKRNKRDTLNGVFVLYFLLFSLLGGCYTFNSENTNKYNKAVAYTEHYRNRESVVVSSSRSGLSRDTNSKYNLRDGLSSVSQESIKKLENTIPHTYKEACMMEYLVECEAHGLSKEHKVIIASVIVNRRYSAYWKYNNLEEVMVADNQFSSLFNWYDRVMIPNKDTKEAVRTVLHGDINRYEVTQGAVFFYNPDACGIVSDMERREYLFSLDGHRFFR